MTRKLKTFFEFIKYHNPNFQEIGGGETRYCIGVKCKNCKISTTGNICTEIGSLNIEEYNYVVRKYPEFFI